MLKRKSDGSFHSISSKSDAALARDRIDDLQTQVIELAKKVGIPALLDEKMELQKSLDGYVLNKGNFESDRWQATRVQAHSRSWDVDKLRSRLSGALYKAIIKVSVDGHKLNELVNAGQINMADIEDALVEKANKPYTKWTPKGKDIQAAGEAEADKLAAMLS